MTRGLFAQPNWDQWAQLALRGRGTPKDIESFLSFKGLDDVDIFALGHPTPFGTRPRTSSSKVMRNKMIFSATDTPWVKGRFLYASDLDQLSKAVNLARGQGCNGLEVLTDISPQWLPHEATLKEEDFLDYFNNLELPPQEQLSFSLRRPEGSLPNEQLSLLTASPQTQLTVSYSWFGDLLSQGAVSQPHDDFLKLYFERSRHPVANHSLRAVIELDGRFLHNAGASIATELAFLTTQAIATLRHGTQLGIPRSELLPQLLFTVSVSDDFFIEVAKLQALGKLWEQVLVSVGVGPSERVLPLKVETSERQISARDPWTNLLRSTVSSAAAILGGAQWINIHSHEARCVATTDGQRLTSQVHNILDEESFLGQVENPTEGAWWFDSAAESLAEKSWQLVQEIERQGGAEKVASNGWLKEKAEEDRELLERAIRNGEKTLVGVNRYCTLNDEVSETRRSQGKANSVAVKEAAVQIEPLVPYYMSSSYEELYVKGQKINDRIDIIALGSPAETTSPMSQLTDFLASAGLAAAAPKYAETPEALKDFLQNLQSPAWICGSKEGITKTETWFDNITKPEALWLSLWTSSPLGNREIWQEWGVNCLVEPLSDRYTALKETLVQLGGWS